MPTLNVDAILSESAPVTREALSIDVGYFMDVRSRH